MAGSELREKLQAWGLRNTAIWCGYRLLEKIGLHFDAVYVSGAEHRPEPPAPEGIRFSEVSQAELAAYIDETNSLSQKFLRNSEDRSDMCYAAFCDDKLVGMRFASRTRAPMTEQLDIVIPEGFLYSYKSWVHPEYRSMGISRRCIWEETQLNRRNYRWIWYIAKSNFPSRMSSYRHPNQRALKMGLIVRVSIFGHQLPYLSRTARWIGLQLVRRDAQPRHTTLR